MSEQDNVNVDTLNDTTDIDNVEDNNDSIPNEDPNYKEYWEEKVKKLEALNKKLYARAKSNESKPLNKQESTITPEWQEKIELKTDGYNEQEIEFIQRNGGKNALSNEFVKTAIETMRAKAKAEAAVVDVDSSKTDIEKQYTLDQLKNMP